MLADISPHQEGAAAAGRVQHLFVATMDAKAVDEVHHLRAGIKLPVFLALGGRQQPFKDAADFLKHIMVAVEIRVPRGLELARRTLNPRLGIMEGISILGTTGLVKPFSHDAYRETIQAALSVAVSSGCRGILLSTGGKSERFARLILKGWPGEAFVQIADFFAFSLEAVRKSRFEAVVLSVFFGKAVKMAQGHPYTHAHAVPLDLGPLAEQARKAGYPNAFCQDLAGANTAREALDLLLANHAEDLIRTVAQNVIEQASRLVRDPVKVRLLLFGYDGSLLLDQLLKYIFLAFKKFQHKIS